MNESLNLGARRPIKMREARWAKATARWLEAVGLRPNLVSCLSTVFAGIAALALVAGKDLSSGANAISLGLAAGCVFMRLMCNLFDGMIAVEGGHRSKSGEIYNDFPDRPSDLLVLLGVGYSLPYAWGPELGWLAGTLAILTAYVRMLGGASGARQYFSGPMAKQHRMFFVIVACVLGAFGSRGFFLAAALVAISAGSVVTIVKRLRLIVLELESSGPEGEKCSLSLVPAGRQVSKV